MSKEIFEVSSLNGWNDFSCNNVQQLSRSLWVRWRYVNITVSLSCLDLSNILYYFIMLSFTLNLIIRICANQSNNFVEAYRKLE